MSADKLSAREAALIAQARAQLGKAPPAPADFSATAQDTRVCRAEPAARTPVLAPEHAEDVPRTDPSERLAALMAAARADSERRRERQRRLYLWAPLVLVSLAGLWALVWMWQRL